MNITEPRSSNTITAIATPYGEGGVSIIKISGCAALKIASKLLKVKQSFIKPKKIFVKKIGILSKAVILYFKNPNSYTGEDVIEIQVLGGPLIAEEILKEVISLGATMAKEGEFTKRALLNGKISLFEAENLLAQIKAETKKELELIDSLENNKNKKEYDTLFKEIIKLSHSLDVFFDFPEENEVSANDIKNIVTSINKKITQIKNQLSDIRISRDGTRIAIIGKPNSGKSSVFNLILGESRSIVTNIKGTTRDVISETILLNDTKCILSDTAGIRKKGNYIENLGIKIAKKMIHTSDIIIYVVDSSKKTEISAFPLLSLLKNKPCLVVLNKRDLLKQKPIVPRETNHISYLPLSTKIKSDKTVLLNKLNSIIASFYSEHTRPFNVSFSTRSELLINEISRYLEQVLEIINSNDDILKVQPLISAAVNNFSEFLGKDSSSSLDEIFSQFCIGK